MKARLSFFLLLALIFAPLAKAQESKAGATAGPVVAFENVNVVPMDRERVLEKQTVIVRDGRIAQIGPADKTKAPEGAIRVDGRGKYLMPGLAEMHGHLPPPQAGEKETAVTLTLFVANGVTTVRGMFGFPNHPALRDKVARGELLGPRLYVAGPALSGNSVPSVEVAQKMVREHKAAGFDLLKVHEGLSLEAYNAVVAAAGEVAIPYGGHIPDKVGLQHALKTKMATIEHLDNYIEALEADNSPIKDADPQTRAAKLPFHLDEKKIAPLATATREAGVWNVPTMALYLNVFSSESGETLAGREEMKYAVPQMLQNWIGQRNNQLKAFDPEAIKRLVEIRRKILKGLHDGGAKIMLGSDSPQFFNIPGFALQREMQAMVDAGLTPYQVLETGTRNPAIYLKTINETGTVEVGKRADLILVDANPLASVANVSRRSGVMVNGRWLPASELNRMLDEIAAMRKG